MRRETNNRFCGLVALSESGQGRLRCIGPAQVSWFPRSTAQVCVRVLRPRPPSSQRPRPVRLLEEVDLVADAQPVEHRPLAVAARQDDANLRCSISKETKRLGPVHLRHHDVEENDVDVGALCQTLSAPRPPLVGGDDLVVGFAQCGGDHPAHAFFVVNDEYDCTTRRRLVHGR